MIISSIILYKCIPCNNLLASILYRPEEITQSMASYTATGSCYNNDLARDIIYTTIYSQGPEGEGGV